MEALVMELKPNIKRAASTSAITALILILVAVIALFFINEIVSLSIFIDTFNELGLNLSAASVSAWASVIVLLGAALLITIQSLSLHHARFSFFTDRLIYTPASVIKLAEIEMPYGMIDSAKINRQNLPKHDGIFLHTKMEKNEKIPIPEVEDAEEKVSQINSLLSQFKMRQFTKAEQAYRMENIMEKI
ncbi:hypothetical protein HYU13_04760 [Candidatus Woesearchaeota archaeon]|nr:hypothetical protein [Candidatus Woesearchaeota archaeon]